MVTDARDNGHRRRLDRFLIERGRRPVVTALTADASTRGYFRVEWGDGTAIACVYPEPGDAAFESFLDTTRLFLTAGLPVAHVLEHDAGLGVIIQEDLGDRTLRDVLADAPAAEGRRRLDEAIAMIASIQAATAQAFEMRSVASRLRFDIEKLTAEMRHFIDSYFTILLNEPLKAHEEELVWAELNEIARELERNATVLCHRDFHAANLMIDPQNRLRIIDHQDARIGSPTYDLVSLLLDRITEPPQREWLAEKRRYFLELRTKFGLFRLDEDDFANEFRVQTIQRCLKAAGTFSYQSAKRGKTYFVPFIKPMLCISLRAAESLGRFPHIQAMLRREIAR
jgi:N-acetylmuramate 1-kinase